MATFQLLRSLPPLLLLILLAAAATAAPVDDICRETKNAALCLSVLNSDARSKTANLPTLAQIAVDAAEFDAGQSKQNIDRALVAEKDPKRRANLLQTKNLWMDALDAVLAAGRDLPARRYAAVKASGKKISDSVAAAAAKWNAGVFPYLKEERKIEIAGEAIAVIAGKL
ncbi:uncharacterized protein LOC127246171 [Andrographis paniculata]|uniref:uncharacterized protein LOC127246171 n=1 Tax=Andrographis paniculata TaxID=175694 RepID=UPI0021E72424|nr:uncharacterized protein LOC127246171 [Andrographis paniculata]